MLVLIFLSSLLKLFIVLGICNGQEVRNVNVLFITETENNAASKAIETVKADLQARTMYEVTAEIMAVQATGDNPKEFLENICSNYSQALAEDQAPHVVIDATTSGTSSEIVKAFTRSLALPTVSGSHGLYGTRIWTNLSYDEDKFLLQVFPPGDKIPEVLKAIADYRKMENIVILHDDSFDMTNKGRFLFENQQIRHIITPLINGLDQIESYLRFGLSNFVVMGRENIVKHIYEKMNAGFFKPNVSWYAVVADEDLNMKLQFDSDIVTVIKLTTEEWNQRRFTRLVENYLFNEEHLITPSFYFDLGLRAVLSVGEMIKNGDFPANMTYITCEEFDGSNTPEREIDLRTSFIRSQEPPIFGRFHFPSEAGQAFNGNSFLQFEMGISIQYGANRTKPVGTWMSGVNSKLTISDEAEMEKIAPRMFIKAITVVKPPFIIVNASAPKGFSGILIDLMDMIAENRNFDYSIEEVADKKYGRVDPTTGKWDGITGALINKEADIALAAVPVHLDRKAVIDYTMPFYRLVGFQIMVKRPDVFTSLFGFVFVLDEYVWLCVLGTFLAVSILIWFYDQFSPFSYQNRKKAFPDDDDKRVFDIKESFWFSIMSITPQGGGEPPKNFSGRFVAITWWIFGFILITLYTANLAAFLTITGMENEIDTINELMQQSKIQFGPLENSDAKNYFSRMYDIENLNYDIWRDMSLNKTLSPYERSKIAVWEYPVGNKYIQLIPTLFNNELPETLEEALFRVENTNETEGFALIADASDIRYLAMQNCSVKPGAGEEFSYRWYALALQLESPLTKMFDESLNSLMSHYVMDKLNEKWWRNETFQNCPEPLDLTMGVTIENIGGIFLLIFIGIGVSCCAMLYEIWYFRYSGHNKALVESELSPNT